MWKSITRNFETICSNHLAINQIYIPLTMGDQLSVDMDEVINTRYGPVRVVVENFILVKCQLSDKSSLSGVNLSSD